MQWNLDDTKPGTDFHTRLALVSVQHLHIGVYYWSGLCKYVKASKIKLFSNMNFKVSQPLLFLKNV